MAEGQYTTRFTVEVTKFANSAEQAARESTVTLGRGLHRDFGDMAVLYRRDGKKKLEVTYDSLAHDAEHEGHFEVISLKEKEKSNGGG